MHLLLDALGFVPVVGIFADIVNGVWYWAEDDYATAIGSFISAVPMIGDTIGMFTTAITGCSKIAKMLSYGTKMFATIGNMALGAYQVSKLFVTCTTNTTTKACHGTESQPQWLQQHF